MTTHFATRPERARTTPRVKTATAAEEAPVLDVLTLALSTDPLARWLWPNPQEYLRHAPDFLKAYGGEAFALGSACYLDGYLGAALWLPPDGYPDEEATMGLFQRTVPEPTHAEAFAVFDQAGHAHPGEPHWYLPVMGIDPAQGGRGYDSALLRAALEVCDRDRQLAYLESSSPRNLPLYERHGFRVLCTIQVGSSPPIFPMVRPPR